jgi:DNA mismatch repair protein MutL
MSGSPGIPATQTMQRPIRELSEHVAAQIAAGEVVERPAAALKELLENALDAEARRITVEIESAGRERIAVHDDGRGIPRSELALAFRRHATSKLARVDDLGRLNSYGFRGEALPAIAAAAGRLRLTSRSASEQTAGAIEFVRGAASAPRPAARAVGTSVEVHDLFAGQPARRAFLAGARAERAAILRVAADAVLANPARSLRISLDGRTPLDHAAVDGLADEAALREALASVFSPEAAHRAVWIEARSERAEIALDGFAGSPADARRTRDRIRLFVNGRPVHDRRLSFAVQDAYRDWLAAGEFPLVVARLNLPPAAVDVNIHPAKTEVKLRDPDAAFSLLGRTIREALARERSGSPMRLAGPNEHPGGAADSAAHERTADSAAAPGGVQARTPIPRMAAPATGPRLHAVAEAAVLPGLPGLEPAPAAALPPLRMVGQLHRTFIIAEGPGGLVLVDQHAAHERVMYERLLAASSRSDEDSAQPLFEPLLLALDAEQAANWDAAAPRLRQLGFDADLFGERTLRLRALPGALAAANAETLVGAVLAELSAGRSGREEPERFDRAAASAACHGSVRRGQVLDPAAMAALLRDLEACENPHSCPHGRPTLIEIPADDVLRRFGRK